MSNNIDVAITDVLEYAVVAGRVRAGRAATVGGAAIGVVVIALPTYVVSLYLFGGRQT